MNVAQKLMGKIIASNLNKDGRTALYNTLVIYLIYQKCQVYISITKPR
jgi:hypothetical protein